MRRSEVPSLEPLCPGSLCLLASSLSHFYVRNGPDFGLTSVSFVMNLRTAETHDQRNNSFLYGDATLSNREAVDRRKGIALAPRSPLAESLP